MADDLLNTLAAMSYYVGSQLPAGWEAVAKEHRLRLDQWTSTRAPRQSAPADDATKIQGFGSELRERAAKAGMVQVLRGEDGWPAGIGWDDLPCLWVRGDITILRHASRSINVTGAFSCTSSGRQVAAAMGNDVAATGWSLLTCANRGISAHALEGTLRQPHAAPIVITTGDLEQRARSVSTFVEAGRRGVIVSPFPPGPSTTQAQQHVCSQLAALASTTTIVVESYPTSSAMAAARTAKQAGRIVAAVPGASTVDLHAGCHQLIVERTATSTTSVQKVFPAAVAADLKARRAGRRIPPPDAVFAS